MFVIKQAVLRPNFTRWWSVFDYNTKSIGFVLNYRKIYIKDFFDTGFYTLIYRVIRR